MYPRVHEVVLCITMWLRYYIRLHVYKVYIDLGCDGASVNLVARAFKGLVKEGHGLLLSGVLLIV